MKVLIVDDERRARERLIRLLAAFEEIEIVGEASHGLEAVELASALKPDAIFLDIQMSGGMDGFEVLENLPDPKPAVIFATAYDQYAIQAFEANATDYLLKPVEPERLARAVVKLRNQQVSVDKLMQSRPPLKRLAGRRLQRLHVLSVESIEAFVADEELVFAVNPDGRFLLNSTLKDLEARLDAAQFVRVHKSSLVNLAKVVEIDPDSRSSGSIRMESGHSLELSRRLRGETPRTPRLVTTALLQSRAAQLLRNRSPSWPSTTNFHFSGTVCGR